LALHIYMFLCLIRVALNTFSLNNQNDSRVSEGVRAGKFSIYWFSLFSVGENFGVRQLLL